MVGAAWATEDLASELAEDLADAERHVAQCQAAYNRSVKGSPEGLAARFALYYAENTRNAALRMSQQHRQAAGARQALKGASTAWAI